MLLAAALAVGIVCCGDSSQPGGAKESEKAFQKLVSAEKALSDEDILSLNAFFISVFAPRGLEDYASTLKLIAGFPKGQSIDVTIDRIVEEGKINHWAQQNISKVIGLKGKLLVQGESRLAESTKKDTYSSSLEVLLQRVKGVQSALISLNNDKVNTFTNSLVAYVEAVKKEQGS